MCVCRIGTLADHRFVLHHVLRCRKGAAPMLQKLVHVPAYTRWSDALVDHFVCELWMIAADFPRASASRTTSAVCIVRCVLCGVRCAVRIVRCALCGTHCVRRCHWPWHKHPQSLVDVCTCIRVGCIPQCVSTKAAQPQILNEGAVLLIPMYLRVLLHVCQAEAERTTSERLAAEWMMLDGDGTDARAFADVFGDEDYVTLLEHLPVESIFSHVLRARTTGGSQHRLGWRGGASTWACRSSVGVPLKCVGVTSGCCVVSTTVPIRALITNPNG